MNHAIFSPSSSSRWITCPASIKAGLFYPSKENKASVNGTIIHQLGEDYLNGIDPLSRDSIKIGDKDVPIDELNISEYMIDLAKSYADYVNAIDAKIKLIELNTMLTDIQKDMFGHSDAVILDKDNILHIIDLKTGLVGVSAEENSQLMLYAYGAYNIIANDYFEEVKGIKLHIYQPNNISTWSTTYDYLKKWVDTVVKPAVKDAESIYPTFRASEKACKYCPCKNDCKEFEKTILDGFDNLVNAGSEIDTTKRVKKEQKQALIAKVNSWSPEAVAKAYRASKLYGMVEDAIVTKAIEYTSKNDPNFSEYKVVRSTTHLAWIDEVKALEVLSKKANIDDIAPRKLKTPTQTKKLLGDEAIEGLAERPIGGFVLASKNDKREDLANEVLKEFDKL